MAELSPEAKSLIRNEFDQLSTKLSTSLIELSFWNWVARILFVAVLGGSIFGLVKFQDYVDDRISLRASSFDRIYLANVLATSGQSQNALQEIGLFVDANRSSDSVSPRKVYDFDDLKLSPSQRNFFNLTVLSAVSYGVELDMVGRYIGSDFWDGLRKSQYFRRELTIGRQWETSRDLNERLAHSYLRFAESTDDIALAMKHFERAATQTTGWSASTNYLAAMFCASMLDDETKATENGVRFLKDSGDIQPLPWDWTVAIAAERSAIRLKRPNLRSTTEKFWSLSVKKNQDDRLALQLAEIKKVDQTFDKFAFEEFAKSKLRANFDKLFREKLIQEDVTAPVFASSSLYGALIGDRFRRRLISVTDARVVAASVAVDTVSVDVRFDFESSAEIPGWDNSAMPLKPFSLSDIWTFVKVSTDKRPDWRISDIGELKALTQLYRR